MTKDEIFAFLNAHPICYLATVEDGHPRVRGMMLFRADEQGLIFHTAQDKAMTAQLRATPFAEVCTFDPESNVQVRVRGAVEFLDDLALKQAIVAERPFLQAAVAQGYDQFILFRVTDCVATVWTMATAMAPPVYIKL